MYLINLNKEQQELFLDLSIHAANANHVLEETERAVLKEYCVEMNLEYREVARESVDVVIEKIKKLSTKKELRKIAVEIVSLILIDGEYDNLEKEFMEKIKKEFDITEEDIEFIIERTTILDIVYRDLEKFVAR